MSISGIKQDFKSTLLVCLILLTGMLPLWMGGYCMYVLILLLPIVLVKVRNYDPLAILVIFFSLIYTFTKYLNGHWYTPSELIFDLFFPFIMCQSGKYIVNKFRNPKSVVLFIVLMACALALPAIVENITDTVKTGQLINVTRVILDKSGEVTRSATGYGMMLAIMDGCISALLIKTYSKTDYRIKALIVIIALGAIFSTIHLLNRTGLFLAVISFIIVAFLPPHSMKKNLYLIGILSCVIFISFIFFKDSIFLTDAVKLYEARDAASGSVSSYGGRSERWYAGFLQLFSQPFGNEKGVLLDGQYTYAHNLWIDAGIKGSLICFILLLVITIVFIKSVIKIYHTKQLSLFERDYMLILSVILLLQMAVEPVIEGLPQFFWFYIFLTSVFIHFNKKRWIV